MIYGIVEHHLGPDSPGWVKLWEIALMGHE